MNLEPGPEVSPGEKVSMDLGSSISSGPSPIQHAMQELATSRAATTMLLLPLLLLCMLLLLYCVPLPTPPSYYYSSSYYWSRLAPVLTKGQGQDQGQGQSQQWVLGLFVFPPVHLSTFPPFHSDHIPIYPE